MDEAYNTDSYSEDDRDQFREVEEPNVTMRELSIDDDRDSEEIQDSQFLLLPTEMREKVYSFLRPKDFLILRFACRALYWELNTFGRFDVFMKSRPIGNPSVEIPFSKIQSLRIDNDLEDFPWGDGESDSVETITFQKTSARTLMNLSLSSLNVKKVTFQQSFFTRILPFQSLSWNYLSHLHVNFHISYDTTVELVMLKNLDRLLEQKFLRLRIFVASCTHVRVPNPQSKYTIRLARFVAKHAKSLKQLSLTIEAMRCVNSQQLAPLSPQTLNEMLQEDFENFRSIQLDSLELSMCELSCPQCIIWHKFIQLQNNLKALHVHVSGASKLSTLFFCNLEKYDQFVRLEALTIRLWGLADFYPLDFRYLACAKNLSILEVGRYTETRIHLATPELLSIEQIPENIRVLSLTGFLINARDVEILLGKLPSLTTFTLLDCGSAPGGREIGFTVEHLSCLARHPSLYLALIDFNATQVNLAVSVKEIEDTILNTSKFPFWSTHLYNVGFCPFHRYEFNRKLDPDLTFNGIQDYAPLSQSETIFGQFHAFEYEPFIY